MKTKPAATAGFTLLEILVALTIFSMSAIMLYKQIHSSVMASDRVKQKYIAMWVGENALNLELARREVPEGGDKTNDVEYLGERWRTIIKIEPADQLNLTRYECNVYLGADEQSPVITVTRFVGKY